MDFLSCALNRVKHEQDLTVVPQDEAKLVPSDASGDLIDTKASYDALSNAERGPPGPPNRK